MAKLKQKNNSKVIPIFLESHFNIVLTINVSDNLRFNFILGLQTYTFKTLIRGKRKDNVNLSSIIFLDLRFKFKVSNYSQTVGSIITLDYEQS